jgi:hypothetical protein
MKRFLWIVLTLSNVSFSLQSSGQTIWRLTIADSATLKGIERATITIGQKKLFSTTNHGVVDIDRSLIGKNDSVKISCIGYKTVSITPGVKYKFPDAIKLSASAIALREVKVGAIDPDIKVGDIKKHYNVHRVTSPSSSYAQFIPNPNKIKGTITSIEYVVNDELHGIEMPFRARLFTKWKDSLTLDKELTRDSIIVYNSKKERRVRVDVAKYNIEFPEDGVIAVFETLSPEHYSKQTTLHWGEEFIRTPGIDMDQTKNYWQGDNSKTDRKTAYAIWGPPADRWNWDGMYDQWSVYMEGNNFAITLTISQ